MRPSGWMRAVRAARPPCTTPSESITPARYISAITSMMPEPQMPVMSRSSVAAAKPGSSLHRSQPITLKRASSVSRSMRTRSIAPAVARWPQLSWAPSNAGPVGLEAANWRCTLPTTISALVPTSTSNCIVGEWCGCSERITAAVSAPTCPAMHGARYTCACGKCSSNCSARTRIGSAVASVNGAWPSGVGSMPATMWCMIGLPTSTISSNADGSAVAVAHSSPISSPRASRTAVVSWRSPPGFIIT